MEQADRRHALELMPFGARDDCDMHFPGSMQLQYPRGFPTGCAGREHIVDQQQGLSGEITGRCKRAPLIFTPRLQGQPCLRRSRARFFQTVSIQFEAASARQCAGNFQRLIEAALLDPLGMKRKRQHAIRRDFRQSKSKMPPPGICQSQLRVIFQGVNQAIKRKGIAVKRVCFCEGGRMLQAIAAAFAARGRNQTDWAAKCRQHRQIGKTTGAEHAVAVWFARRRAAKETNRRQKNIKRS